MLDPVFYLFTCPGTADVNEPFAHSGAIMCCTMSLLKKERTLFIELVLSCSKTISFSLWVNERKRNFFDQRDDGVCFSSVSVLMWCPYWP